MNKKLLENVRQDIELNGLQDNIEIVGWVPHHEIVNYISVSKLGLVPLLPTRKFLKNIPIKQFEYMACGIPVLGANLPPIASYINACGCGRTFDSTNFEAFASAIMDMLQNESEWQCMSEAGKKAIREMWNWDRMEERLFDVYETILNEKFETPRATSELSLVERALEI
jgi:glycosyltransferase involved in cell wall biosynthesis